MEKSEATNSKNRSGHYHQRPYRHKQTVRRQPSAFMMIDSAAQVKRVNPEKTLTTESH